MKVILLILVCCFLVADSKKISLHEIIDATLSEKMDETFDVKTKECTAKALLEYSIASTTIDPKYLTDVFVEAFDLTSEDELTKKKVKLSQAVDYMNKVIKHFQKASDNAGRPKPNEKEEVKTDQGQSSDKEEL